LICSAYRIRQLAQIGVHHISLDTGDGDRGHATAIRANDDPTTVPLRNAESAAPYRLRTNGDAQPGQVALALGIGTALLVVVPRHAWMYMYQYMIMYNIMYEKRANLDRS
jgi:hypothetical protein